MADFVRHLGQDSIALLDAGQLAAIDGVVEQDLDVDLVVGGVDAGGVVDGVGVDAAAGERELDARALGESEVRAFADHADAEIARVDAQRVVGPVARGGVILVRRLDVRADAAEPQQVGARAQDGADQLRRRQRLFLQIEAALHFIRDGQDFFAALVNRAARGEERRVVSVPVEALVEHPPALGEARRRIGIGVKEDVRVVERREQFRLRREQHRVSEDVAGHVADADAGEIG